MKLFQTIAIIFLATSTNITFAARSSTIPLSGSSISPGEFFKLSLEKLYSGLDYNVSCTLKNANVTADAISEFQLLTGKFTNPKIDGKPINYGSSTATHYNSAGSTLTIEHVINTTEINLRNLDFTDNMLLENCFASLNVLG